MSDSCPNCGDTTRDMYAMINTRTRTLAFIVTYCLNCNFISSEDVIQENPYEAYERAMKGIQ